MNEREDKFMSNFGDILYEKIICTGPGGFQSGNLSPLPGSILVTSRTNHISDNKPPWPGGHCNPVPPPPLVIYPLPKTPSFQLNE